jgi:hypothetical protein
MAKLYWLSDAEFARIEPLLPRGRRGTLRRWALPSWLRSAESLHVDSL